MEKQSGWSKEELIMTRELKFESDYSFTVRAELEGDRTSANWNDWVVDFRADSC